MIKYGAWILLGYQPEAGSFECKIFFIQGVYLNKADLIGIF